MRSPKSGTWLCRESDTPTQGLCNLKQKSGLKVCMVGKRTEGTGKPWERVVEQGWQLCQTSEQDTKHRDTAAGQQWKPRTDPLNMKTQDWIKQPLRSLGETLKKWCWLHSLYLAPFSVSSNKSVIGSIPLTSTRENKNQLPYNPQLKKSFPNNGSK